jgi:hypothetical protein
MWCVPIICVRTGTTSLPALSRNVCSLRHCSTGVAAQIPRRARIVGVEHRKTLVAEMVEELGFGLAIVAQRGVVVQMIACDIGHAGGVKARPGHARLVQGMAGNLHHCVGTLVADHSRQQRRQSIGRRRRVRGRLDNSAVQIAQSAQDADAMAGRTEHSCYQAACRRLAVGAGHSDQLQLAGRTAGQRLAQSGVGLPGVWDDAAGYGAFGHRPIGEHRRAAARGRFGNELMPVVPAADEGGEQLALADLPRIARAAGDVEIIGADNLGLRQKLPQANEMSQIGTDLHGPRPPCRGAR